MKISDILQTLPDSLEWMVLFNLSAIRNLAEETTIKAMYHLPEDITLQAYSHVVLTSNGRFLASENEPKVIEPLSGKFLSKDKNKTNLYDRFSNQLKLFSIDESDCIGLGETSPFPPVLLNIKIESGVGQAQAVFEKEPNFKHYELLKAVGVKFISGEQKESYYLARFQNRLPVHIHAGILSHFSRTAHCNLFFLQHGNIDPPLEKGLLQASDARINWGKNYNLRLLAKLAHKGCQEPLAMICQPPPPSPIFPYGDLVPLGFVLKALNLPEVSEDIVKARQKLEEYLLSRQEEKLWAFHSTRLITATDSALVLQGFNLPESVDALESFADGEGGYYPQLWSSEKQLGKMVYDESCAHWCQADYATTCMVRALRHKARLETKTSLEYITKGFETRSGLYFANPYLVDWVLASAISQDRSAESLRQKLIAEILASINNDYSFGHYDLTFSTALAILSLTELGIRNRLIKVIQLRLLELMETKASATIPFYSSLKITEEEASSKDFLEMMLIQTLTPQNSSNIVQKQVRKIQGEYHGISLYIDKYQLIKKSVVALAFAEKNFFSKPMIDLTKYTQNIHPRYQCHNHCEYIAKFALVPYLR